MSASETKKAAEKMDETAGQILEKPHAHDVLCGRGGLTNQHSGNEWFRRLVRSNRALYRSCPKHTKLLVAKAIVQAVQQQEPPGRFLEVADRQKSTWRQITYKRAVDKTSQALREKDFPPPKSPPLDAKNAKTPPTQQPPPPMPEQSNEDDAPLVDDELTQKAVKTAAKLQSKQGNKEPADLSELTQLTLGAAKFDKPGGGAISASVFAEQLAAKTKASSAAAAAVKEPRKRKASASASSTSAQGAEGRSFVKPPWWRRGAPNVAGRAMTPPVPPVKVFLENAREQQQQPQQQTNNKRMRLEQPQQSQDDPLPPTAPLESRQSSYFGFLSMSGLFGQQNSQQMINNTNFTQNNNYNNNPNAMPPRMQPRQSGPRPSLFGSSLYALTFGGANDRLEQQHPQQEEGDALDPLPLDAPESNHRMSAGTASAVAAAAGRPSQTPTNFNNNNNNNNYFIPQQFSLFHQMQLIQKRQSIQLQQQQQLRQQQQLQQQQLLQQQHEERLRHQQQLQLQQQQKLPMNAPRLSYGNSEAIFEPLDANTNEEEDVSDLLAAAPIFKRLTSQVSDWLGGFLPVSASADEQNDNNNARPTSAHGLSPTPPQNSDPIEQHQQQQDDSRIHNLQVEVDVDVDVDVDVQLDNANDDDDDDFNPLPPTQNGLERSVSSTLFNLARTPSQFLSNFKSGVSSIFLGGSRAASADGSNDGENDDNTNNTNDGAGFPPPPSAPPPLSASHAPPAANSQTNDAVTPLIGSQSSHRDSLLDDIEETPLEARLRTIPLQ